MKHTFQLLLCLTGVILVAGALAYFLTYIICAPVEVGPYPLEK